MLRKSLIAFTAATVVGFGSQAEAAGFSHAMSALEIPIAKLDRKGLIGRGCTITKAQKNPNIRDFKNLIEIKEGLSKIVLIE